MSSQVVVPLKNCWGIRQAEGKRMISDNHGHAYSINGTNPAILPSDFPRSSGLSQYILKGFEHLSMLSPKITYQLVTLEIYLKSYLKAIEIYRKLYTTLSDSYDYQTQHHNICEPYSYVLSSLRKCESVFNGHVFNLFAVFSALCLKRWWISSKRLKGWNWKGYIFLTFPTLIFRLDSSLPFETQSALPYRQL